MSRPLSNLAALLTALASLIVAPQAQAACTAGHANGNLVESTPSSAFTDHGDGTVTHALTGLMWKQCAQGLSGAGCVTGTATAMIWSAALTSSVTDRTAGYTDWRLPNKKELESLVELCGYNPAINQSVFPATPASTFWSASSYAANPVFAWYINLIDGGVYFAPDKSNDNYVRLVRGGQSFDSFDATGLIFANGFE